MHRLTLPILCAAALSGCVAVPYDAPYAVYPPAPVVTYPYAVAPVYPAPAYAEPVYIGPPVQFGFSYRSGGSRHRDHHHGHGHSHRHDHELRPRSHGFGQHHYGGARREFRQ